MSEVGLISEPSLPGEIMPKASISAITTIIDAIAERGLLNMISRKARAIGIIMDGIMRSLRFMA